MILPSDDLIEWISTRKDQLVAAWTPQIEKTLGWESPFAEALADELHTAMVTALTRGGSETHFLKLIARSNTGLEQEDERAIAQRFYGVTLKLARASGKKRQGDQGSFVAPLKRVVVIGDTRTNPGHLALGGIVLPLGHPFWERWEPPLDMDCRCMTIQVTRNEFERDGLAITSPDELAQREAEISAS